VLRIVLAAIAVAAWARGGAAANDKATMVPSTRAPDVAGNFTWNWRDGGCRIIAETFTMGITVVLIRFRRFRYFLNYKKLKNGLFSSSVDGTLICTRSFHITVRAPEVRSGKASVDTLRYAVYFGRDLRDTQLGRRTSGPTRPRTSIFAPQPGRGSYSPKPLSSFHPPSLRHTQCDLPLSFSLCVV
jgi:hypothetical protein